ncbi:MAG: cytochrome c4, partial [Rhodocyclales bacterium]|nr:cytochrome c4 [Rhodocyclales bacterium]
GLALFAAAAQAEVAGDPTPAAPILNTVCIPCHGADGNGTVPMFPRLAGQTAEYLLKQLQDFKKNKRPSEVMGPNVANLSDADMANLALFFAGQKAVPAPAGDPELLAKGKKLFDEGNTASGVPACSGCHGPTGAGSPLYPRIAAQHVEYTINELKDFATGKRKNDKRLMQTIATRLTDDESKAVAHYLASLP